MRPTVWTKQRQWMGNLVPMALGTPWMVAGLTLSVLRGELLGIGLLFLIAGVATTWLSVNLFGFWGSATMERQLVEILTQRGLDLPVERWFVGICTPRHRGLLDAHEDVGFVFRQGEQLIFQGEFRRLELDRHGLLPPKFRPNVHSFLLLGRWVMLEGVQGSTPVRLAMEPRTRKTMLGNLVAGKALRFWVNQWVGTAAQPALAPRRAKPKRPQLPPKSK